MHPQAEGFEHAVFQRGNLGLLNESACPPAVETLRLVLCTEKRQAEAARIRDKYPDRIPVSSAGCDAVLHVQGTIADTALDLVVDLLKYRR